MNSADENVPIALHKMRTPGSPAEIGRIGELKTRADPDRHAGAQRRSERERA